MLERKFVRALLCLVVALSFSATGAMGDNILFIVNADQASYPNDALIGDFLESLGHTVTYFDDTGDEAATEAAAAAADLVWISESIGSSNVANEITEVEVPIVVGEPYCWDEMGMTRAGGSTSDVATTDITIVSPGHPMAAGLTGTVSVLTGITGSAGTAQFANGDAGDEATVIATATLADGQTYDVILVYEKGAALAVQPTDGSGPFAADIRIGMFFHYYAHDVLNENAYALIGAAVKYVLGVKPKARTPKPRNGALYEDIWATLEWSPGDFALSHDVYFGDNFDDVNDGAEGTFVGNQVSTLFIVGFPDMPYPDGLVPGTTYYWRVDEINEQDPNSPWKGDVWSFWIPPKTAYEPNPVDDTKFVNLDAELSWTTGFGTKLHYVYFGENFDDVNNATVGIPSAFNTYTPGTLEVGKTYYWRIDEFDGIATHKGDVWNFSTIPIIPITDPSLVGWWKFDEGPGGTAVDWSGHDNHGSLTGTALSWMPDDGMIGGALSFDGTASDTDYVEISTADISLTAGTVAMWGKLRPDPQLPATRYFFGHTTIPAFSDRIQLYMDNSDTMLDLGLGDSHARQTDIMSLSTDTWYHVALTWNGGNYAVYVNGEQKANGSYTGLDTLNTVADIGNDGDTNGRTEAFNGLLDNVRIYNYALSQAEIPLAMRGDPLAAWAPNPATGSTPYIRDATPLSWSKGDNASQHDVYFGTDKDAVADADASDTTGIYRGRQGVTFYTPPDVEWGGGPYYWRIDEYNTDGIISRGNVWSFTVTDFIVIDDIEDYNDYPPDEIFSTWIDGWEVPENGSLAGHPDPPFAETGNVHGGRQSMPVYYENNFKYSEATMTLSYPRNWTEEGVGVLSLWFRGNSNNAAERMYVNLNGIATIYHDNPNAALIDTWTEWRIDLQEFAAKGVNLANVNTISIGFGDKSNLQAGGSGMVLFDDIRLYRPPAP